MQTEGQAPPSPFCAWHQYSSPEDKPCKQKGKTHLDFFGALGSAADIAVRHWDEIREAVTAGLIHQIPCKDGGVILVQPVIDGVTPVDHCINVVPEQLLDIWVCEERVVSLSACPLDILHHKSLLVMLVANANCLATPA